jgi:hypothetical protein
MNVALRVSVLAGFLVQLVAPAALALDVTFDANATSLTIINDGPGDLNTIDLGVIDFDLTATPVGGVLSGSGRVQESSGPIGTGVQLGGPPAGQGVLQNISISSQTFTVTMNSSPFSAGPPLGWTIVYDADFDDPTLGPVSSPGGIVELTINQSSVPVPLGAVPQPVISVPTSFFDLVRGSNPALTAAESRVTYTVDLGPDDRVLLDDLQIASGIDGFVFNQDYKCIDRMNNASGKLADTAAKIDAKCVSTQYKLGGGDATPCVDDPVEPKTNARETKQLTDYVTHCPTLPAWGVNGASCCEEGTNEGLACTVPADCPGGSCLPGACITHAAEDAANDLSHELFGAGVIVSAAAGKCQYDLTRRAGGVLKERWKVFRTCKKANVQTIPDDITLVSTCLGPPQPDPNLRISNADGKVVQAITKCISAGFSPVGAQFGGACSAVPDVGFAACVGERTRCAFCRAVNVADDIAPSLDCDLFDDTVANSSCP